VYVYCTFLPTRHPALTPSPCQFDCCSQSRIEPETLEGSRQNSIRQREKSSEIAVQQSSLESRVEQPQTPHHTLKNSREGAAFPRTTSTRPPWHRNPETENEQAKTRLSSWSSKVLRGASVSAKVQTGVHNFRLRKLEKLSVRCRTDVGESDVGGTGRKGEAAKGLG